MSDVSYIKSCLSYDAQNGLLTWSHRPPDHFNSSQGWKMWNTRYAGKFAGGPDNMGYMRLSINGALYKAHRIAWLLYYGAWPDGDLDHANGDKQDNRIENLRLVNHTENMRNKKLYDNNASGHPGVSFVLRHQKWRACIGLDGKVKHLGWFSNAADAVLARKQAETAAQFHKNHGRNKC